MNNEFEKGNILISALLVLVLMNFLGIGLVNSSVREATVATYKAIDSEVFHITESCTHDVITWFEGQTGTPASVDDITVTSLSSIASGSESSAQLAKLTGYSYGCSTTYITSKNVSVASAGASQGGEIGNSGGDYGGSGTILKDYYQVVSTGTGPKNASKTINTIISVSY